MPNKIYAQEKERIRQKAIEYQQWFGERDMSYDEIVVYQNYFEKQGKRYGLLKEFRENGIL